jgi:oligopeptide/dipeptide ABC transporter ATP-binding protein
VPLLEVNSLRVSFRGDQGFLPVVRGVDISLDEGETLSIVGESGSGKSVTSLALMGLLGPEARVEGTFSFEGEDFSPEKGTLRGHGMSMIFQNPMSSLNPVMKVGKQVSEPLTLGGKMKPNQAKDKVLELFSEVGLPHRESFFHAYPHQLSGGMRQRVMIAIALACEPKVLLADEPTTALDVTIQAQILTLLKQIQERRRMALVMVTHDMSVVESVADRVAVMYAGQFVEVGAKTEVLGKPQHPYTEALLRSIPRLTREVPERLLTIPGRPPGPGEVGEGCPFAPRCPEVKETCRGKTPELKGHERSVRCLIREATA